MHYVTLLMKKVNKKKLIKNSFEFIKIWINNFYKLDYLFNAEVNTCSKSFKEKCK